MGPIHELDFKEAPVLIPHAERMNDGTVRIGQVWSNGAYSVNGEAPPDMVEFSRKQADDLMEWLEDTQVEHEGDDPDPVPIMNRIDTLKQRLRGMSNHPDHPFKRHTS